MISEIKKLLEQYRIWLDDHTFLREINDWVEITTPYLDRHNDYIQIYVRKTNGKYLLTDDGFTIRDLELSGVTVGTESRMNLLTLTARGFGIDYEDGQLKVVTLPEEFSIKKHNLVQAIISINDLFFL